MRKNGNRNSSCPGPSFPLPLPNLLQTIATAVGNDFTDIPSYTMGCKSNEGFVGINMSIIFNVFFVICKDSDVKNLFSHNPFHYLTAIMRDTFLNPIAKQPVQQGLQETCKS